MTDTILTDRTPTGEQPVITEPSNLAEALARGRAQLDAERPHFSWPTTSRPTGRRRADRIGVEPGARAVSTFPGIDLTRTSERRTSPGQPVPVSALLARMRGNR